MQERKEEELKGRGEEGRIRKCKKGRKGVKRDGEWEIKEGRTR